MRPEQKSSLARHHVLSHTHSVTVSMDADEIQMFISYSEHWSFIQMEFNADERHLIDLMLFDTQFNNKISWYDMFNRSLMLL